MFSDGSAFLNRARIFITSLQGGTFPNASKLAIETSCSKSTAQRTIDRLREEYLMPIDYHLVERGYYLTNKTFKFPEILPPGKDELTAFVIAKSFLSRINDQTLNQKFHEIYYDYLSKSLHPKIAEELKPINDYFSCDFTSISKIADLGILSLLESAVIGNNLKVTYLTAWSDHKKRIFLGRIKKIHYSDGNLYTLFLTTAGKYKTLNVAFIKKIEILDTILKFSKDPEDNHRGNENWLEGFGIWSGGNLEEVTIKINPPAAGYYATQVWHHSQEDIWEGKVLVRKMQAHLSPELERRILSIGEYLLDVKPKELKERIIYKCNKITESLNN